MKVNDKSKYTNEMRDKITTMQPSCGRRLMDAAHLIMEGTIQFAVADEITDEVAAIYEQALRDIAPLMGCHGTNAGLPCATECSNACMAATAILQVPPAKMRELIKKRG